MSKKETALWILELCDFQMFHGSDELLCEWIDDLKTALCD
jgi:hypothetical protein